MNFNKFSRGECFPATQSVVFCQETGLLPVSLVEYHHVDDSNDESISFSVANDIYLLFDQKRLNSIGPDAVRAFVDNINRNVSSSRSVRLSDDALFSFIKSRHIQSMSELQSWSQYLIDNMAQLEEEYKNAAKSADVDSDASTPPIAVDDGTTEVAS